MCLSFPFFLFPSFFLIFLLQLGHWASNPIVAKPDPPKLKWDQKTEKYYNYLYYIIKYRYDAAIHAAYIFMSGLK